MEKFIPKEKLGKKARKALHLRNRATWEGLNPATRRMESKKRYNRKKTRIMEKNQYPGFDFTDGKTLFFMIINPGYLGSNVTASAYFSLLSFSFRGMTVSMSIS